MAKRIAPPKTGKHETQSLLTGGADKDTKYFSQDKLAPNKEAPKLVTGEYPIEPKLLGRGAAGANAAEAEDLLQAIPAQERLLVALIFEEHLSGPACGCFETP